eukprot:tig00021348_g20540.t1
MYSGIAGTEFHADIFIGVVYYQRLRHMVSDKYQVRSTGPVNQLHRQPVKGRKVGGGIRLGEMERDSLLAHGCSYLLYDRLMRCSDDHRAQVCGKCGSLVAVHRRYESAHGRAAEVAEAAAVAAAMGTTLKETAVVAETLVPPGLKGGPMGGAYVCRACGDAGNRSITTVNVPYVLVYLAHELAAMNIRLDLTVKQI